MARIVKWPGAVRLKMLGSNRSKQFAHERSKLLLPQTDEELITRIRNLQLEFSVGVLPEEKLAKQPVIISVWMSSICNWRHDSDDIDAYVSYADLVERIKNLSQSGRHIDLVETLAEEIAELAFLDPRIVKVIVAVDKPAIILEAEGVGITVRRSRET